ncbi:MAG: type III-B CRISPR module-associated protein Cmr5 [Chloroflexota bacterium]
MTTRSQKFAHAAHELVAQFRDANADESERKKYGSMAHKLPVLVRTGGLVQAVAFVETRGSDPQKTLLADLASVLEYENVRSFADDTRTHNLQEYMLLTRHTLDALLWFKRFAESVLNVQAGDESEEG